jgi:multiple sugar transport system permease protein
MGISQRTIRPQRVVLFLTLFILLVLALFPIYWMVNTSLKTDGEVYRNIPTFWPQKLVLNSYLTLFFKTGFLTFLKNSMVVSCLVSLLSVFVSMLAAYAIVRIDFVGKALFSKVILYAYLMPKSIMYIPLYMITVFVGLSNSLNGLILVYPTIIIPYATWMLIAYFQSIPDELEEAAFIDGCSRLKAMFYIVYPLAAPGIMSTLVFSFTLCWGEYLYALTIISDKVCKTIPLGLTDLIQDDIFAWGQLAAGAILASIPIVLMYMLASEYITSGMTVGGVKG